MSGAVPAEVRLLVGGLARSGTTVVQRLCCELASMWVPPETHFWSSAEALDREFEFPVRGEARVAAVEWVVRDLAGRGVAVGVADVLEQISARKRGVGLWTLFESVVAALSPPDRPVLGEKTPQHLLWWEQLAPAVPGLRLVVVVRDPRAVLRSHRSVEWGETDAYALSERWLAFQHAAGEARRLLGGDRVLVLRYEDVARDPGAARTEIARFAGVPDDVRPLTAGILDAHPLFPGRETWKARALQPVEAEQRPPGDDLPAADRAIVEAVCGAEMERAGYDPGAGAACPPPQGDALDRVTAFRRWHASIKAFNPWTVY